MPFHFKKKLNHIISIRVYKIFFFFLFDLQKKVESNFYAWQLIATFLNLGGFWCQNQRFWHFNVSSNIFDFTFCFLWVFLEGMRNFSMFDFWWKTDKVFVYFKYWIFILRSAVTVTHILIFSSKSHYLNEKWLFRSLRKLISWSQKNNRIINHKLFIFLLFFSTLWTPLKTQRNFVQLHKHKPQRSFQSSPRILLIASTFI